MKTPLQTSRSQRTFSLPHLFRRLLPPGFEEAQAVAAPAHIPLGAPYGIRLRLHYTQRRRSHVARTGNAWPAS